MAENTSLGVPKQTAVKIVIYIAIILAVFFLGNYQSKLRVDKLSKEIAETKGEIKRQKALHPVYVKLKTDYERKVLNELQLVETVPMRQDEVDKATDLMDRMATLSGITATSIQPDPSSLADDPNQLLVNVELNGEFQDYREFLKKLGAIQYVKHIQQIVATEAADELNYSMKVRLAVLSENATKSAEKAAQ